MIDREMVIARATEEMKRIDALGDIQIQISIPKVCQVISNLQLAMRHPENTTRKEVREICDTIIGALQKLSPDLADFMRLGYDKKYDQ